MESFIGGTGTRWAYDETERIGDISGMGQVYRGLAPDGSPIACKLIHQNAQPDHPHRIPREVEIVELVEASRATHALPNVFRTLDTAKTEKGHFLVMPLAQRSLRADIRNYHSLTESETLEILRQIAEGLAQLVAVGVVHRDIKPENTLLTADGEWALADFGISRDTARSTATRTYQGWGTPEYMAPELWRGSNTSSKSDLYALGVIAYELVMGRQPFTGNQEEVRAQHLTEIPVLAASISPMFERLISRLLAKNPLDRPSNPRAALNRIASVQHNNNNNNLRSEIANAAKRATRSAEAAQLKQATTNLGVEARLNAWEQARSDLHSIIADAGDILEAALPESSISFTGNAWTIADDNEPLISVQIASQYESARSPWVIGAIYAAQRDRPIADLLYAEDDSTASIWRIYRTMSVELSPDTWHGRGLAQFRAFLLEPARDWRGDQITTEETTGSAIAGLVLEVIKGNAY